MYLKHFFSDYRSQSKASYLAYRRERGAPDSEGSYKRTMSPTARLEDWQQQHSATSRDHDDPVLLRVTPHHPSQLHHQHSHPPHPSQNSLQSSDLPKSHSVDALHQRIEERNSVHSSEVMGKLSHELTKKLQATENRSRPESNNNNIVNNNDCQDKRQDYKERLSPQSVQVLNDRNRQLERERRKLAASCEPVASQNRSLAGGEAASQGIEDFYRERSATIEMTSRNVELLNRRNALAEKRVTSNTGSNNVSLNCASSNNSSSAIVDNPKEISNSRVNEAHPEKPPVPMSSPPRSPDSFARGAESPAASLRNLRGAVPRRSGSCSSSSSNSTRSSNDPAAPSSRSSPQKLAFGSQNYGNEQPVKLHRELEGAQLSSRRKVSSPSQTENSWTGLNSPRARSSQTEGSIASFRRNSSSRSRSSSISSASKISSTSSSSASPRYSPVDGKSSPCVSPQPGIEGLTMVQRTEIVLRVNAATSDASSQTEIFDEEDAGDCKEIVDEEVAPEPRRKLPEEIECEELSRDLASQLGPNDKLVPILGGLFFVGFSLTRLPRCASHLRISLLSFVIKNFEQVYKPVMRVVTFR